MWRPGQWLVVGASLAGLTACATSQHIAEIGTTSTSPVVVPTSPSSAPSTPPPTEVPGTPEPTAPSTVDRPTVPTIEPPVDPPTEDPRRIKGVVYSIVLPAGWQDFTSQVRGSQSQVDVAIGRVLPTGGIIELLVLNPRQQLLPSQVGSPKARADFLRGIAGETDGKVIRAADIRIDHELAIGVRTTSPVGGRHVTFLAYLPTHFDQMYPVALVYTPSDRAAANRGFRSVIASWHWAR